MPDPVFALTFLQEMAKIALTFLQNMSNYMFYRNILNNLRKWAAKPNRKPLVLRGARHESAKDLYVIAAGSLLEVMLGEQLSFPVGRVEYLFMHPLYFIRRYAGNH